MASSSPLSESPSSLSRPSTPTQDRSRKRGSYDPSTPRTARRSRSSSVSQGPMADEEVLRPPRREGGKGKGKEVATPLLFPTFSTGSQLAGRPDMQYSTVLSVGRPSIGSLNFEPDDESDHSSPTPAASKNVRLLLKGKKFFTSDIDRSWTAHESEKAQGVIMARFTRMAKHATAQQDGLFGRLSKLVGPILHDLAKQGEGNAKATDSLATTTATYQASLDRRVDEISGQMVSMVLR